MADKIPLRQKVIYGPVNSRRLGKSLGINLTPPGTKICSFDCVYCQYGETEVKSRVYDPQNAPTPEMVGESLEEALEELSKDPDYLTFSGNGEPTLHPEFGKILEVVRKVRNRTSEAKIALLSNSSKVNQRDFLTSINKVDVPIMKLDVGSPEKFHQINRPLQIQFQEVVDNLKKIENLHLQSLKFTGELGNLGEDLQKWAGIVEELEPREVQIYSLDRPCRFNLEKAGKDRLEEIKRVLAKKGIESGIY
ncbi:MAG: radical SAM protein [Candidatus Bipolaricaulota bacterium]